MNGFDWARGVRRARAVLATIALAALVAGCGSTSKEIAGLTCPRILPAPGTEKIAIFGPNGHTANDVQVGGTIMDAATTCKFEKTGIAVNAEITFYAERADFKITDATLPYFVALLDPNQQVLVQDAYEVHVKFYPGEGYRRMPAEKITVHLPIKNTSAGNAFTVIIGFQLTPDQLAFNRAARQAQ